MRKISLFSLIIVSILSLFIGIFQAWAAGNNWSWSNTEAVSTQAYFCKDWDETCSLNGGLKAAKEAIGDDVTDKWVVDYSQDIVIYLLGFISLIGVIYIIWSGFRILTSGGDEESLKNAKQTILYIALGMFLMWLAYPIIQWIMGLINGKTAYSERNKTFFAFNIVPTVHAQAYSESQNGTFAEYKNKIIVAAEEMEAELKVQKKVSPNTISNMKSLIQQAFDRLPDKNPEAARQNESGKRLVEMYLDLAVKEPDSQQAVGTAISQAVAFAQNAKIETIQGSISATPTSWNAPLVTSFSAQNVIDPSGAIPPSSNYIWWIRENGGVRRELGRGPSLTQEFTNEGTYTVHLDVVSGSRNSKGRTDVLPLSTSTTIQVQPKLGEITLLVNGINVSNMNDIKITPAIASQGLMFDATASRAIGNGRILETKWDFGNGNTRVYKSSPGVERQIFATSGEFPVKLSFTTNDGKTFSKDITLRIVDPAATIKVNKTTVHAGEALSFSAETFFGNVRNVEYIWRVQDNNTGKRETQSSNGSTSAFNYTFEKIGSYTVTLTAKSPNGSIDEDSKTITVESRDPIATLDAPKQFNQEKPNTFIFDASRSYDPDTNTRQGLTYTWRLNGELVTLDELDGTSADDRGSRGTLTFDSLGENTISVTVANAHGKIATAEQKFKVNSVLSGNLLITPQVTQVGQEVTFIAQSKNAQFYTWNLGDGSPQKSGSDRTVKHRYEKTGVYTVSLTLQWAESNDTTTITRKVYITDMDSPFAVINFSNSSNSIIQEPWICDGKDAYILKRGESTQINGSKSINVDGSTSNLDYTWRVMGKPVTLPSLNETFKDLGCFPITLTVKSKTNGASHTTTEYIKLENQAPVLTNISTSIDSSKQDSQKIIVKAKANGVSDSDGVITSYIWYYTTASDNEAQGLQITQKPEMTFVLPNITEKYYFGVIIEDNDGARIDSKNILSTNAPLIIDNENSNIHLPLITLRTNNKAVKVGQPVNFIAEAKTILGSDITSKAQFAWDFDGDGRIDERSASSSISHTYNKAWDYTARVRVTNNGVTNTKTITITVRNELKASVQGYKLPTNKLFLLNTSAGVYDKAQWKIGENTYSTLDSVILDFEEVPSADEKWSIGTLKIWSNDTENSSTDIVLKEIETIENGGEDNLVYQSYPKAVNDTITLSDPSQSVKISFYGNNATNYAIDSDLNIDGFGENMDGTTDNDIDNRETASYTDGSLYVISDFATTKTRERKIKLTTYNNSTPIATKTLTVILDFIPEVTAQESNFSNEDIEWLSDFEKERLESLATSIRKLEDADRIIVMQQYNKIVENWASPFEKAKNLLDLQILINERPNITESDRANISNIIDQLLINDADTTNAVMVAVNLIRGLIPENSINRAAMLEKIDAIASHPTDSVANKKIGEELLLLIRDEPSSNLDDRYKLIIHQQLKVILAKWDTSKVPVEPENADNNSSSGGGIMGIFKSVGTIILWILGIIFLIILGLFVWYKIQSKDDNLGFQDFVIDRLANKEPKNTETPMVAPIVETKKEEKVEEIDPLKTYTPPAETTPTVDPLKTEPETTEIIPDWLKPANNDTTTNSDPLSANTEAPAPLENQSGGLPSWLAPAANNQASPLPETSSENFSQNSSENNSDPLAQNNNWVLPDWLSGGTTTSENNFSEPTDNATSEIKENISTENPNFSENTSNTIAEQPTSGLPDWLNPDATPNNTQPVETNISETSDNNNPLPDWLSSETVTSETTTSDITETISENNNSGELPDWLGNSQKTETSSEKNNFGDSTDSNDPFENSNFSYTASKDNNSENFTTEKTDDNLPDWLRESAEQMSSIEESSKKDFIETAVETAKEVGNNFVETVQNTAKETKNTIINTAEEKIETAKNSLPEWLDSNNSTTTETTKKSVKNTSLEEQFEEKIVKEMKNTETKKSAKNKKSSQNDDNIPEWLK